MKKVIVLIALFFSSLTQAQESTSNISLDGWHLLAGGGLNSSLYSSEHERVEGGVGLNLKTDLVYFFNDDWALDAGSSVKFNRIDGFLIWDTQFILGVRRNLPEFGFWQLREPYIRIFAGRAPTVIFLDGEDLPTKVHSQDINRIQFDGSVYGLTVGNMARTQKGTIWFSELSMTYQTIERASEIKMDGEVPTVNYEGPADPHSNMYTITFSIGALIF